MNVLSIAERCPPFALGSRHPDGDNYTRARRPRIVSDSQWRRWLCDGCCLKETARPNPYFSHTLIASAGWPQVGLPCKPPCIWQSKSAPVLNSPSTGLRKFWDQQAPALPPPGTTLRSNGCFRFRGGSFPVPC